MTHTLTPADIADLRASLRTRPTSESPLGLPYILWGEADALFYLHAYGRVMAAHHDPRVLGAMLVAERAERGFIAAVLDTTHTVDEALLDPAGRKRAAQRRNAEAASQRERDTIADERRRNARRNVNVASITLDDLI